MFLFKPRFVIILIISTLIGATVYLVRKELTRSAGKPSAEQKVERGEQVRLPAGPGATSIPGA